MKDLIVNDWHLGPSRVGGTTQLSALALADDLNKAHADLIMSHLDKHLVINGDLLDKFEVSIRSMGQAYTTLDTWLSESAQEAKLFLLGGNHDISAKGDRISSFQFLCELLQNKWGSHKVFVALAGGVHNLHDSLWAIPHCLNQDLFDMELDHALDQVPENSDLLLHCNYDNNHAAQSDHSLNISADMAQAFIDKGIRLILGHEHNKRVLKQGKVYILGNQFPSSVVDCLDPYGRKCAHIRDEDGTLTEVVTTDLSKVFARPDWKDLADLEGFRFIRVEGECSAELSPDMLKMISKLRSRSDAYVITNAVSVDGIGTLEGMEEVNFEQIKEFDVLQELLKRLDPPEQEIVLQLMEKARAA